MTEYSYTRCSAVVLALYQVVAADQSNLPARTRSLAKTNCEKLPCHVNSNFKP